MAEVEKLCWEERWGGGGQLARGLLVRAFRGAASVWVGLRVEPETGLGIPGSRNEVAGRVK